MATDKIIHLSDGDFGRDVLEAGGPILVDFWAPWCGPCRAIAPMLEDIAASHEGKVTVAKLNVDDNPEIATRYGVRGIPTMMVFKGGAVAATKVGAAPKAQLVAWLDGALEAA